VAGEGWLKEKRKFLVKLYKKDVGEGIAEIDHRNYGRAVPRQTRSLDRGKKGVDDNARGKAI
jgi:hypothetical protein